MNLKKNKQIALSSLNINLLTKHNSIVLNSGLNKPLDLLNLKIFKSQYLENATEEVLLLMFDKG